VYTRWIETEFSAPLEPQDIPGTEAAEPRSRLTVEVGGKRLEVTVPAVLSVSGAGTASPQRNGASRSSRRSRSGGGASKVTGDSLVTPMQGTIVKIVAEEGSVVSAGDTVVILEAMKMEQPLAAHKAGTVTGLSVTVGQTVTADTEICQIKD
jgi:acetyl-CoA/propionyl-CoA carboxylase biotin carboxyl carrier protein